MREGTVSHPTLTTSPTASDCGSNSSRPATKAEVQGSLARHRRHRVAGDYHRDARQIPFRQLRKTESSATTGSGPTAQETQFNALTPSEHLSQAKTALNQNATPDQIEEGLRHLRAIPETSPEAVQAKSLTTKLVRAQHLAEARLLIDSAPVDDLKANLENLRKANDEIQAVLQQNAHDKDALKLLTLATNKGREALGGSQQTRQAFAQDLQQRLTSMGYDITVWVHGEGADSGHELNLDSEMFKDTATRVQFINDVLPEWKKDLCRVGFRQVRLRQGGTFELGQDYSLGCQNP